MIFRKEAETAMDDEIVRIPIEDVLDLHTFLPREVRDLLDDYFEACLAQGIFSVRVIHGKGRGVLKKRVRAILAGHPLVDRFGDAPENAGGWGATLVSLKAP